MAGLAEDTILAFLTELGQRHPQPADLFLLGGSALCLLGSPRPTMDIDYVGDDLSKNELQRTIDEVAADMGIEVEAVPIAGFVSLAEDAHERNVSIGQFGVIKVFLLDPYTIALSKVDRGYDTDIEDVVFLIRRKFVRLEKLETLVHDALHRAAEFSLSRSDLLEHLQAVKKQI